MSRQYATTMSPPMQGYPAQDERRGFLLSLQRGKGHLLSQILTIIFIGFIPYEVQTPHFIRLMLMAVSFCLIIWHYKQVLPQMIRDRLFFIYPAICFVSLLWSAVPVETVIFSTYILFTLLVAFWIASKLDQRQFVVCLYIAGVLSALLSLVFPNYTEIANQEVAFIGVFTHKNVLGVRMMLLLLCALVIISDKRYEVIWRLSAPVAVLLSMYLISISLSITAILMSVIALSIAGFLAFIWRPARHVYMLRPVLLCATILTTATIFLVYMNITASNPILELLDSYGRDTTLTGRTHIWAIAEEKIAERPWLGVGVNAFWQDYMNDATRITKIFGLTTNYFYFHNIYYEVLVHLGFVGLAVFLWVYGKAAFGIVTHWWRYQGALDSFFIVALALIFARGFVESDLVYPLSLPAIIFWVGAILARDATRQSPRLEISD